MSTGRVSGRFQPPGFHDDRADKPNAPGVRQHKYTGWVLSFFKLTFKDAGGHWINKGSAVGYINRFRKAQGNQNPLSKNESLRKVKDTFNSIVYPKRISPDNPSAGKPSGKKTVKSVSLDAELRDEEIAYLKNNIRDEMFNTGLTALLAGYAFHDPASYRQDKGKIDAFIEKLAEKALTDPAAKAALLTANAEAVKVDGMSKKDLKKGFPRNTPLHLLVKMGNLEGAKAILPFYDRDHLLAKTPGGNTALHLAFATGQVDLALEMMLQAKELGCLEELLERENSASFSPGDIYKKYQSASNKHSPDDAHISTGESILHFANRFFGGHEELDKAIVVNKSVSVATTKTQIFSLFQKISKNEKIKLKEVEQLDLAVLFEYFLKLDGKSLHPGAKADGPPDDETKGASA